MDKEEWEEIGEKIRAGYLSAHLCPLKCPRCESTDVKSKIRAVDCGIVSEEEAYCGNCDSHLGYWAYGHWQV